MPAFNRDSLAAFLSELKRRHVFRVAVVYAVIAWAIAEVSDTVLPRLQIPDVAVTFIIVLLILGLPVALVLAWAYDITPQGVERTLSVQELEPRPAPLATAAAARPEPLDTAAIRTIVALPFANLTPAEDGDYFSDGITEELISALGRVPGLRVVGRTSAFALKNRAQDIREIGAQLGVDAAVEGSVRRVGRQVRINVQLTDVRAGYQLWSATYDRELADVLTIQEEIARALVTELQPGAALATGPLVRPSTADVGAYRHYLQGRFFWNQRTGEALQRAIRSFEAAVTADPTYALAHAGIADCHSILLDYGVESPAERLPRARAAAERALSLDPGLAETHTSVALVRQVACEWTEAEAGFQRAIELGPDYVVAHHRYALLLAWQGRDADAMERITTARELDPLSPVVATTIGWIHYWARRPDAAAVECRDVLSTDPTFVNARVALGLACLQLSAPEEAVAQLRTAAELSAGSPSILPLLGLAARAAGNIEEAREIRTKVDAASENGFVSPYYRALAALATGDSDDALALLRQAVRMRSPQIAYLKVEPLLDELRTQPGFAELLAESRLA